jgi:hypothetical protein
MATKSVTLTRRSIVGYGFTSACEQDERGHLQVCDTTKPDYTGTIKQVMRKIEADRELKLYKSGGTYYSEAWFARINGKWAKLVWDQQYNPADLLTPYCGDGKVYDFDRLTVEIC